MGASIQTSTNIASDTPVTVDPTTKVPDPLIYPIPDGIINVIVRIARATTQDQSTLPDPATHVAICALVSFDNGNTWIHAGTITTNGGIELDVNNAYSQIPLQIPLGKSRLIKVHYSIICGPATTLKSTIIAKS